MKYNLLKTPDPEEWLELDEDERIHFVVVHHKKAKVKLPNAHIHAVIHVTVENQLAEGYEVVRETLERLMADGLDRHDAIHAIGAVLIEHLQSIMRQELKGPDPHEKYFHALRSLTAQRWFELYS